jgi:hypothetical protein
MSYSLLPDPVSEEELAELRLATSSKDGLTKAERRRKPSNLVASQPTITEQDLVARNNDLERQLEQAQRAPIQAIIEHLEAKHQQELDKLNIELQLTKKRVAELEQLLRIEG